MKDIFAHTISRVDFLDGMIRIELVTLAPGGGETTGIEPKYALHMPLTGFMRGAMTLENFIREMVNRGILPSTPPAAENADQKASPLSPNFA
jgi:hypothetical protein